jgi:hypothetical protein
MNTKGLSDEAIFEIMYFIYKGVDAEIDKIHDNDSLVKKEVLEEIIKWYKDNVIIDYNSLKEKFNRIK